MAVFLENGWDILLLLSEYIAVAKIKKLIIVLIAVVIKDKSNR